MVQETTALLPRKQLLRLPAVRALTGLSRSTIYAYITTGRFPAPVAPRPRAVGWDSTAIAAWIEDRLSQGQDERPVSPWPEAVKSLQEGQSHD